MSAYAVNQGPSALGGSFRRFVDLTLTLAVVDFKLRFFGSVLGYVWTLLRPLLLFGILYFIFTRVVDIGADVKHYPVYLLTSLVLFNFFQETTSNGLTSLIARETMLRKMRFPRLVIPISVALTSLFNLATSMIAVLVFALASGVNPRWSWLQLPVIVLLLAVLSVGLAMLLSVLYVRFRDIGPIWDVLLQILFYASPILYVITLLPDNVERKLLANPLAALFTQMRHAVIDPSAPSLSETMGGNVRMLIPLAITLGVFLTGWLMFKREAPRIAENL